MKKGNNFLSFLFALVAIGGAVVAVCAYLKSKRAAKEIREDFLADLGYEFDDSGCYCGEENHCCDEAMLRRILKKNPWKNSFWVKNRGEFPSCFFVAENRLYEGRLKENRKKFVTAFYKIGIFNKE